MCLFLQTYTYGPALALAMGTGRLAPRLGACYILSAFDKLAVALRKVRAAAAAVASGL